jgi:methyl-accepting chemotaxis protein
VDESGKVLEEIVTGVKKVTDVMAEIAGSSREQASGIEQVNKAVTHMDAMTQQNAALVEEDTAAAQALSAQPRVSQS